ncbi:MAG TPA: metallopeptidase family protein [Patescibacteria group bacterium]|nr:metallopeptidase family protein [Patescibacteria group bacterium]
MDQTEFESLVRESLDSLPKKIAERLNNVEVMVDVWPDEEELRAGNIKPGMTLFGLYRGVPQTHRINYNAAIPDNITIFMGPFLSIFGDNRLLLKQEVKKTVLHEIGHHFGMSDEEIRAAGK